MSVFNVRCVVELQLGLVRGLVRMAVNVLDGL